MERITETDLLLKYQSETGIQVTNLQTLKEYVDYTNWLTERLLGYINLNLQVTKVMAEASEQEQLETINQELQMASHEDDVCCGKCQKNWEE